MNCFDRVRVVSFLWFVLLFACRAQAMQIWDLDRVSTNDQGNHIGVLILGAEHTLIDDGRPEQAVQVTRMFHKQPGREVWTGIAEFELKLSEVRAADADDLVKNPIARRLPVDIATVAML